MKIHIISLITIAILATTSSCNNNANKKAATDNEKIVANKKTTRHHIKVAGNFYQITNIGSIDIVFSEGDYNIDVECDSSLLPYVSATFDSGILTVCMKQEEKADIDWDIAQSDVALYVSCPNIRYIAICGSGSFKSIGKIHSTDMQIGNFGSGDIELDSVECETFEYELHTDSKISFNNIHCNKAKLMSHGTGHITSDIDANTVYAIIGDAGDMECSFRADNIDIASLSTGNGIFNVESKNLNVSAHGSGKIVLNGHADQPNIRSGKNALIENNLH